MHTLINRAIEGFLRDIYGEDLWQAVAVSSGADRRGFAAVGARRANVSLAMVDHACRCLDKPRDELLQDLGAWIAGRESIRRLLRFSGDSYGSFLDSLHELPGRAHLVVPDLGMPRLVVSDEADGWRRVRLQDAAIEWCPVMAGLMRAMADDYGALSLIETEGDVIRVHVSDGAFAQGRAFDLAGPPPGAGGPAQRALP